MIRLKYTEVEGKLVSKEVVGNGNTLVVHIDPSQLRYKVTNLSGEHVFEEGQSTNLTAVKLLAKKALVAQGVAFTAEVRNRTPKLVQE